MRHLYIGSNSFHYIKTGQGWVTPPEAVCEGVIKKGVLKNSAKFAGNTCVGAPIQVFSREFCESFKNCFFTEHLRVATSDPFLQKVVEDGAKKENINNYSYV